jgi:hypothetical protein
MQRVSKRRLDAAEKASKKKEKDDLLRDEEAKIEEQLKKRKGLK